MHTHTYPVVQGFVLNVSLLISMLFFAKMFKRAKKTNPFMTNNVITQKGLL